MTGEVPEVPKRYNLLVYGAERKGLSPPEKSLQDRNYTLSFEPFKTQRRFIDFDGVIVFQGTFEEYEYKHPPYGRRHVKHRFDRDELDKRKNELKLLLSNGGFACFLLCEAFLDHDEGRSFESTDLAKVYLNLRSFYRKNLQARMTSIRIKRDEFRRFLEIYGAASTYFEKYNDSIEWRVICDINRHVVGMVLWDDRYFIPTLIPENVPERIEEYFRLLADALTATAKKLTIEIPLWVEDFRFSDEQPLDDRRAALLEELQGIEASVSRLRGFKRILTLSAEPLVDAVQELLTDGFGLDIDATDELREDLKIMSPDGTPSIFVEVKGTNRSVKREHINQADSHRERAELPADFPTVLVVNTHVKGARAIEEKDQEIAAEQVRYASANNILVLRTLDLLRLLELHLRGDLATEMLIEVLKTNVGWLCVREGAIEIRKE